MSDFKVIYIVGAGRSGSTLLSMVLGASSEAVSIGELKLFDRYMDGDSTCGCGASFQDCSLWKNIIPVRKAGPGEPLAPVISQKKFVLSAPGSFDQDAGIKAMVGANASLYQAIHAVSSKRFIVDASKDPMRLHFLMRLGSIEIVPVFIARDVRSYILSRRNKGEGSAFRSVLRWMRMNLVCIAGLHKSGSWKNSVHVTYPQFTRDPLGTVRFVCQQTGLPFDEQMLEYWDADHHNIAGSDVRRARRPVQPESEPFKAITLLDRFWIAVLGAGRLNSWLGLK